MVESNLEFYAIPEKKGFGLVVGLSGWMDGGEVSTGTVEYLVDKLKAKECAAIAPEGFYIYNFPGSMEVSALFRPHCRIENGIIVEYTPPGNTFFISEEKGLLFFVGKEPHMEWESFADCIIETCERYEVTQVFFVGSYAGGTPHTREPIIRSSSSDLELSEKLKTIGIRLVNYEGPASFITYLTTRAAEIGLPMATLVAEVPAYIEGTNPRSIDTMVRLLSQLFNLKVNDTDLRSTIEVFDTKLADLIENNEDIADKVRELEKQYDEEAFEWGLKEQKNNPDDPAEDNKSEDLEV